MVLAWELVLDCCCYCRVLVPHRSCCPESIAFWVVSILLGVDWFRRCSNHYRRRHRGGGDGDFVRRGGGLFGSTRLLLLPRRRTNFDTALCNEFSLPCFLSALAILGRPQPTDAGRMQCLACRVYVYSHEWMIRN